MINNKLLPNLSQNLLEISNDDEYCDIAIEVGNDPFVKIFRAHMVILHYSSPYLQRILSTHKNFLHIEYPPELFLKICSFLPLTYLFPLLYRKFRDRSLKI